MVSELPPSTVRDVCARLAVPHRGRRDMASLSVVYRAWCASVPFDNVRKSIALHERLAGPLPGSHAGDFFEAWLAHGTGGTCWAGSTALHALLTALGYDAIRAVASMRDTGEANHATVRVVMDGTTWLLDSSMLTGAPIPLPVARERPSDADPTSELLPCDVEVEPTPDATFANTIVWFDAPPRPTLFPCRLLRDSVDARFFLDAYERSRVSSPFNQSLYARRYRDREKLVLRANTRIVKGAVGTEITTLTPRELRAALHDDIGVSHAMIERWAASGALDACYEIAMGPHTTEPSRLPPSARRRTDARDATPES